MGRHHNLFEFSKAQCRAINPKLTLEQSLGEFLIVAR